MHQPWNRVLGEVAPRVSGEVGLGIGNGASASVVQATSGICHQRRASNGLINQHRIIGTRMMDYWRRAWATAAAAHLRWVDPW